MKLQLFNNLAARLRAHKIIGGVIIGLLGALAVAGSSINTGRRANMPSPK